MTGTNMRGIVFWPAALALAAGSLQAQAPATYTVTQVNSFFGPDLKVRVYRSGSKARLDNLQNGTTPATTRTIYDLAAHHAFSWDTSQADPQCGMSNFSGDWGDPWSMTAEVTKDNPKQTGTETVNGIATKVLEESTPEAKVKAWIDPKTNLIIKLEVTPPGAATKIMLQTTELSLAPPPASTFDMPKSCTAAAAAAANAPKVPTDAERIAAETGESADDFVQAIHGPASNGGCLIELRVVAAGSMQPVTTNFQIGVDTTTADPEHLPHYVIGADRVGGPMFSGGGLHDVTNQLRNGVLRIAGAGKTFEIDMIFGNGDAGYASGLIYRQCSAPQTVLLLVVKNPAKISDGADWLFVKSGKYKTTP